MGFEIIQVTITNYNRFDDMVHWRMTGEERKSNDNIICDDIIKELANRNLYIYVAESNSKFVGWISLVYIPKVGKFNGNGHIFVDELWVENHYRNKGIAKALLEKANELSVKLCAVATRLYVNIENPIAQSLYEKCGYNSKCTAILMEK